MGLFSKIMDKIFHHKPTAPPTAQTTSTGTPAPAPSPATVTQAPPPPAPEPVDVEGVLASMAEMDEARGGNWRTSIVDLLKLLKLDSSLDARKELAEELNVHAGPAGSAEQNIALHKAVMAKLAANGGVVPDSFYT